MAIAMIISALIISCGVAASVLGCKYLECRAGDMKYSRYREIMKTLNEIKEEL